MIKIDYRVNSDIVSSEIVEVFHSVGWNKDEKLVEAAFKNSYYVLAYNEDKLIGFARALSDNYYYTGIYDVVVKPEFQGKGIGKQMMSYIVSRFKGTYFFLTYTDGNREFYEKCGFQDNSQAMWIPK